MAEAHTHTQEKCVRPWRFSLVLDAQCQIERVRIVPSKSSFVFDLDGSLLHKVFYFCVMLSPFYCFLDGSVVDIYFSCCVSTPSSAKLMITGYVLFCVYLVLPQLIRFKVMRTFDLTVRLIIFISLLI